MADVIQLRNTAVVQNIQHKHAPKPRAVRSWKEYWCDQSEEEWPETCRVRGCGRTADGSAHVNVNGDEDLVYIIPTCDYHLSFGFSEPFSVNSGTFAVYISEDFIITQLTENVVKNFDTLSLKSGMEVKNISGTHACKPRGYGSWKKYWIENAGREWPSTCRISYCGEPAKGGGHVDVTGKCGVFILPMCERHNTAQNKDWLPVKKDAIAVRVGEGDTSGPPGICYCKRQNLFVHLLHSIFSCNK